MRIGLSTSHFGNEHSHDREKAEDKRPHVDLRDSTLSTRMPQWLWVHHHQAMASAMSGITLAEVLARETREGDLYETLPDGRLRCYACGHCCPLPEGAIGVCKVRFNEGGRLLVPWGYVGGVQCDPIEKKPFFHAHPGALAYSFGMLGCDLHCSYCQNWVTSQALRDPAAVAPPLGTSPGDLVADALRQQARVMVSTYNEPLITSEWAVAVFKEAKAAGLVTGYVSNGNGTPQVLEYHQAVGRSLQGRSQEL